MYSTCGNLCFPCFIKSPPSHNLALSGTLTTAIPYHLRHSSEYPPIRQEVERMRTVVTARISAPKEAEAERNPKIDLLFSYISRLHL
ncbi:hypothetical protein L873DRAFT_1810473 [Choiromyces venosus 120613-1]|uniref:Uncharacterized protein n=1 Tax=Choiromyces venosus 120613-1 TaxID=1336337 RepID=A0A3N4JFC7_9PEZI|nr:hypothetical protein L873DRAFT_1810473 [Choiromyces venosus 120613-1]